MSTYTATTLNLDSDRVPALSALVSVMQPQIDDVYMAGLWKNDICRDLAWFDCEKDGGTAVLHDCDQYNVLSWSWALARTAINRAECIIREDDKEGTAQDLDVQLELAIPEAFGQTGCGHFEVQGIVAFAVIRTRPLEDAREINDMSFFDDNDEMMKNGQEGNILRNFHLDGSSNLGHIP